MTWPSAPLGSIAEVQLGKMLSPKAKTGTSAFPYLRNVNVQWGRIDLSDLVEMDFDESEREKFSLKKGDLVVCEGGEPGRCAVVESDLPGVYFQKALMRVRPRDARVDTRFLQRFMGFAAQRGTFARGGNQATIAHFPANKLNALEVPLPPIDEQRRIAAILDKADTIRRKHQESIALTDDLLRSSFLEMFGDSTRNPRQWTVESLGESCHRVTDGTHQSPEFVAQGIPFLFISNILGGRIDYETKKFITEDTWQALTRTTPIEPGDVLYATVGSYGNAVIVEGDRKFAFQRHIAHIKPNHARFNSRFLLSQLRSSGVRNQVDDLVRGVAQKTLNLGDLKQVRVMIPPMDEQRRFADVSVHIEQMRQRQEHALEAANALVASLVAEVFGLRNSERIAC